MHLGIYGASGLGREFYDIASRRNAISSLWEDIFFIDDDKEKKVVNGVKCVQLEQAINNGIEFECIIGIGEPITRKKIMLKLTNFGVNLATLIDSTAIISPTAKIDKGCIICEYTTIHSNVVIGNNCLIQPFCAIGHDIIIGGNSVFSAFCAPGGQSVFGDSVYVGMHSSIKEQITVGDRAIISMGAAVFYDVPSGSTVVGNPARITLGNAERKVFK
jgi:sugar O-acyltransferase (sialic acid O-acetyltransferase NeuD family)